MDIAGSLFLLLMIYLLTPLKKKLKLWKPFVVSFLYVYSFPHRINMENLIDLKILLGPNDAPRGFKPITKEQFEIILKETRSDESFIVD